MFLFDSLLIATIFLVAIVVFIAVRNTMKDRDKEKNSKRSDKFLDTINGGEQWKN